MIRSQYGAARLSGEAPLDTIHFRAFYPAAPTGSDIERLSGVIPADLSNGPMPIVLIMPGINVPPDSYTWLATFLAGRGYIAVPFGAVADVFGGNIGLTPGIDLAAVTPSSYGSAPTASGVKPVLEALVDLNAAGPLEGAIDLDSVVLFGHSAGGTIALQSANTDYFPSVKAAVAYGAHTMASTMLGFDEDTILAVSDSVPILLLAGEHDGVMDASRDRYGSGGNHDPVNRTFDEGLTRSKSDSWLAVFADANHLTVCEPHDPTTARGFLDAHEPTDPDGVRMAIASTMAAFLDVSLRQTDPEELMSCLQSDSVTTWRSR